MSQVRHDAHSGRMAHHKLHQVVAQYTSAPYPPGMWMIVCHNIYGVGIEDQEAILGTVDQMESFVRQHCDAQGGVGYSQAAETLIDFIRTAAQGVCCVRSKAGVDRHILYNDYERMMVGPAWLCLDVTDQMLDLHEVYDRDDPQSLRNGDLIKVTVL